MFSIYHNKYAIINPFKCPSPPRPRPREQLHRRMLKREPEERIAVDDFFRHAWLDLEAYQRTIVIGPDDTATGMSLDGILLWVSWGSVSLIYPVPIRLVVWLRRHFVWGCRGSLMEMVLDRR